MDQKYRHAKDFRDTYGVTRPILIDSLDGACHHTYGGMPNMTWIFNQSGIPVYKSNWTDISSVDKAIEYLFEVRERRRYKEKLTPFKVEKLDYRVQDQEAFFEGLKRNGQKAVDEFIYEFR